ncbi:FapA family protein [Bacillus sp. FJAT-47783]|uniref:FapA family protein n=1 Tax=Bacillus sp. FJAT-47783 TaxID=2922712 RepID=UPI001FADF189|nr:FapA family protein [Bacillus sp. FJAT-47783]
MNSEKGSTLIIVLLSITILLTLGTILIAQSLTTAKQREQTESNYRATHLAEFGVSYVKERIESYLTENPPHGNLKDYIQFMLTTIQDDVNRYQVDEHHQERKISLDSVSMKINHVHNEAILDIKVTGDDGRHKKTLTATFSIHASNNKNNDWLNEAANYWLDESKYDWITDQVSYPEKPQSGTIVNRHIEWNNKVFRRNENLILNNGEKISKSTIDVNHFYNENELESSDTIYSINGFSVFNNGGSFSHDELSSKGMYAKNSMHIMQSTFSIDGPSKYLSVFNLGDSHYETTSVYVQNMMYSASSTVSVDDYLMLKSGARFRYSDIESKYFYVTIFITIYNANVDVEGFSYFNNIWLYSNANVNVKGDVFVKGLYDARNKSSMKACGNGIFKSVVDVEGDIKVGKNMYVQNRLTMKNGSIVTGGSLYANGGMDLHNGSGQLIVGGDLIINQKAGASTLNNNQIVVLGDLILLNVPKNQQELFSLRKNLFVTGDILVYYEGEDEPKVNEEANFHTPAMLEFQGQKKFKKGTIIYRYPNSEEIEINGCDPVSRPMDTSVELEHVQY